MSEFQTSPPNNVPEPPQTSPPPKKQSLLRRPLILGQSLPWLAGGILILLVAGWYLFWPASSSSDAGQLAFGNEAGFNEVRPVALPPQSAAVPQMTGLHAPVETVTNTATGATLPEDVVKIIREGQDFEAANREAITRLSETVRAQTAALASLQQRINAIESENNRLASQLTVMNARREPATGKPSAGKGTRRSALSGMRLESMQDGMAWVSWQGRTWAVQSGDSLGGITVRDVNVVDRSVTTSAGVLR